MEPGSHHLYVHVPFCRLVCAYCDFVTVAGRADDIGRYADALVAELDLRPAAGHLRTIYFGGGTPSLLPADRVGALIDAAIARWPSVALEEVTLEANPSAREAPDWAGLRAAGVDRLSLGVQSLRDADLAALARGHTGREARDACAAARGAGFENVSFDLIYGIPGQTLEDWRAGLAEAIALEPDHVSCYALQLALEPDEWAAPPREGALRWRRRMAARQDDGLAAAQYRLAEADLADAGFIHYELSSWARPGRESRHNAAYWARRPYTGIGVGAHSFDGEATRSWHARELEPYLAAIEAGDLPPGAGESLDEPARAFEAIALGLRRLAGVDRAAFGAEFGQDPIERFGDRDELDGATDLLEWDDHSLRLTPRGRLYASEALLAFLPEPVVTDARPLAR